MGGGYGKGQAGNNSELAAAKKKPFAKTKAAGVGGGAVFTFHPHPPHLGRN